MASDLVKAEAEATAVISSPALQKLRRLSLGTVQWSDQPMRKYLSGGLTLTESERTTAEYLLRQLKLSAEGPSTPETRMARLGLLSKMLLVYPVANASSEAGQARGEAYLETLGDIAPWAIDKAIRKWHRGDCGDKHNYQFAPAPATLLEICRLILWQELQAIEHLDGLLNAIPLERAMDLKPLERGNVTVFTPKMQRM